MVYAESATAFEDSMKVLKERIPVSNASSQLIEYLDDLSMSRDTFVKYKICDYEGSHFLRGSTSSEQNHSSVISYLDVNSRRYKVDLHTFAKDLFRRQKELVAKQFSVLGLSLIERHAFLDSSHMSPFGPPEQVDLRVAHTCLNLPSFKLFRQQVHNAKNLVREESDTEEKIVVRPIGENNPNRKQVFPLVENDNDRCPCSFRKAYMLQCKHEYAAYRKFIPSFFQPYHHFRTAIQVSSNMGTYRNDYSSYYEDGFPGKEVESDIHACENRDEDSVSVDDHDPMAQEQDCTILEVTENEGISQDEIIRDPIPTYGQMKLEMDNIMKQWQSSKDQTELRMAYSLAKAWSSSYLKPEGFTGFLKRQEGFVQPTQSLAPKNIPVTVVGTGKQKRLKSQNEVVLSQQAPRKCSFCKEEGHRDRSCNVKKSLGREMTTADFSSHVLCHSSYRIATAEDGANDTIKPHLPQLCFYLSVRGVVLKNASKRHRGSSSKATSFHSSASPTFEWKDVALDIKCVSNCGVEIENGLYEGESVSGFCMKHGMRMVFINDSTNNGFEWLRRK